MFFARRLAASFETYQVCRAYQTREIPTQSHVHLGVFFRKSPNPSGRQNVNNQKTNWKVWKCLKLLS